MLIRGSLGDRAGLAPLKSALTAYALRHRVISSNIANAEVDGYRPRRVVFEDVARRALAESGGVEGYVTNPAHMPVGVGSGGSVTPRIETEPPSVLPDGTTVESGVDMEKEMVALVENQLNYRLAVRLLDMKYTQLHKAIRGTTR